MGHGKVWQQGARGWGWGEYPEYYSRLHVRERAEARGKHDVQRQFYLQKSNKYLPGGGAHSLCPEEKGRGFQRSSPGLSLTAGGVSRLAIEGSAHVSYYVMHSAGTRRASVLIREVAQLAALEAATQVDEALASEGRGDSSCCCCCCLCNGAGCWRGPIGAGCCWGEGAVGCWNGSRVVAEPA